MFAKSILVSALAALAAAQSTVVSFTNPLPAPAVVGTPLQLTYSTTDSSTPVTILLRKGNPNDLKTVATLTSSATGGSYQWTPASDLEDGSDYALQIQQGTEINYLGPFPLQGGSKAGSSSSSSSTAMSTTPTVPTSVSASRTMTTVAPYPTGNTTTIGNANATGAAGGAAFTGNATGPNVPQSTGGASTLMAGGSAIALVLGAVAVCIMA